MAPDALSPTPLTDLLLRLIRAGWRHPWPTLTTPAEALDLLRDPTDHDLRTLRRCFPRTADLLLRRLQQTLELPEAPVTAAIHRLERLPPDAAPDPFASPEGVDWAVERFRLLWRRR